MGRRGARAKPLEDALARGDRYAKAKLKQGAPAAPIVELDKERPPCPEWVCERGKQEWDWFCDNVSMLNVYAESDYNTLATGAHTFGMFVTYELQNQTEGFYVTGKDGVSRLTAWAKNAVVYHDKWYRWAREFGLTPAARADVRMVKKAKTGSAGKSKAEKFG